MVFSFFLPIATLALIVLIGERDPIVVCVVYLQLFFLFVLHILSQNSNFFIRVLFKIKIKIASHLKLISIIIQGFF